MFDIVTYCSLTYLARLEKTIGSWCLQERVRNIFVYSDVPLALPDNIPNSEKIIYKNIYKPSRKRNDSLSVFGDHCAQKAISFQDFMNTHLFDNTIFMDVDCLIVKDLSCIFDQDFDVAVTVYPEVKVKLQTKNISAGFLAVKNTDNAKEIINLWVDTQDGLERQTPCRDQKALSKVIRTLEKDGKMKIKLLDGNVFNSHPYSGAIGFIKEWMQRIIKNKPFILHFASDSIKSQDIIDKALIEAS